jgi:sulfur-oxidizing protein SoxZ
VARALVTSPKSAKRGEIIEIRTLIAHPMETGYRPGEDGKTVPRNLIRHLRCEYDDITVFSAELYPAVAANPFISFFTVATSSGVLKFTWEGDNGFAQIERVPLTVT